MCPFAWVVQIPPCTSYKVLLAYDLSRHLNKVSSNDLLYKISPSIKYSIVILLRVFLSVFEASEGYSFVILLRVFLSVFEASEGYSRY